MRLRQLECYVRTCELGSISRAAEQLNVAQPALGLQIRNLELDFGATLLVRTSRGVSATPAGELMLEWARDVIARTRDVKERLRHLDRADVDVLTLGLSPSVTYLLGGAILEKSSREIDGLTLRIVEGLSHVIVKQVEEQRIDIALVTGPVRNREMEQTPVLREHLYLIGKAGSDAGPVTLAAALALPLAMPGENDALRGIVESEARRLDLPLTTAYEISSIPAINALVARGMAYAILPYGAVRREIRTGELVARRIIQPDLSRTLCLVRPQGRAAGPRETKLIAAIRESVAEMIEGEADGAFELL